MATEAAEPPIKIRHHWEAVIIHGDSGYPIVWPGQTVLIDRRLPVTKDRLVVVRTEDGHVIKRFSGISGDDGHEVASLSSINFGLGSLTIPADEFETRAWVVVGIVFTDSVAK